MPADRQRPVVNAQPQKKVVRRVVNGEPQPVVREEAVAQRPPVRKVVKRAPINWGAVKESLNTGLVSRIVFLTVAVIFFLCSFFSVVTFDMTDNFKEYIGEEKIRVDGKITVDYSATDLIDFAFFVMGTDYDSALDFIEDSEIEDSYDEILEDEDFYKVSIVTGTVTITSKGCQAISKLASDTDLIKYSYANIVAGMDEDINPSGLVSSLVTAGFLSLANIICATVVLVLAALNMFSRKGKSGIVLVAVMFAMAIGLWAVLCGVTVDVGFGDGDIVNMGGALASIVAFSVIYFAYRLGVRILTEKNESVKSLVANAVALVAGIVVICCATSPAINATYTYEPEEEDARNVKFKFSYSQFETFDHYFYDVGEDLYQDSETVKDNFDMIGNYYSDAKDRADGEVLLKNSYGLVTLLNTKFISEEYGIVKALLKLQPILSVVAVYCAALAISFALAGLCGGKNVKAIKGIAFIVIIIAAAYGMFSTILFNTALGMSELLPKISLAVGSGPILQLIFAIIGVVGVCVAMMFKNKQLGKKEVYDPLAEYDDEDGAFADDENRENCYVYDDGNQDVYFEEVTEKDELADDDVFVQEEIADGEPASEEAAEEPVEENQETVSDKEASDEKNKDNSDK